MGLQSCFRGTPRGSRANLRSRAVHCILPAAALATFSIMSLTGIQGAAGATGQGSTTSTTTTTTTTTPTTTTTTTPPNGSTTNTSKQAGTTVSIHDTAYWMDASNGAVYSFGGAPNYGSMAGQPLNKPIVGMASMPTGRGYWEVASDGGVFTFGAANFYGSEGNVKLVAPVVGMTAAPTGHGYWLVAADGGVFTFGSANFFGSEGGVKLVAPIVGMSATRTGQGYWLVAADGGIFTFGNATFFGSMGGHVLAQPITGMATMPTGTGYWLVATDGGVFTFGGGGTTRFYGSLGAQLLTQPIVGISSLYNGTGYWLASASGGVTPFGQAIFWGSAPQHVTAPIVGIATGVGNGDPGSPSFQPGSSGYDVSGYQCGQLPPSPHQVGVVEVAGWSYGSVNPCLQQEVTWAAGGLNLYTFLSYGKSTTPEPGCAANPTAPTPTACNYGYGAALQAYQQAQAAVATRANVPWWLDVESGGNWSPTNVTTNRSVAVGAFDALHYTANINTVGFYFSLSRWNDLVGRYNPPGPLFPAWWTGPTPAYKCANARTTAASLGDILPTGPIQLIQYTDSVKNMPFDGDYAC